MFFFFKQKTAYEIGLGIPAEPSSDLNNIMVTLHEVITFLVSMQISISSLQTHNVNRCGRSRHLARKLSLRRKRSSPNVFEMAATEEIMSQVTEQSVRFQTALASIKLIQASAVLDLTEDDFDFLTSNKVWIATDRSRARRCVEACVYGTLDFVGYPRFPAPVEFIAAIMSQVTEQSVRFQTALASIKLIQASAVLDLTEDDFDFLTSNKVWIATDRSRARRCVEACVYGTLDFVGYPRFPAPVEFIAAVI